MAVRIVRSNFLAHLQKFRAVRLQSSEAAASLVNVKLNESNGVAVVSMNGPPVNSLNLEMIQSLSQTLVGLEKKKCRGFILTSSLPTIFCAGLDIREMYQPKEDRLKAFWTGLQDLWLQLYGSKMASVALINGHSPAGGCLLAMTCDYRIMVDGKSKIGLNETKLGIVAPTWFKDSMVHTIGLRQTELALQLGTLFSPTEALQIGLVDKLVPDLQSGVAAAEAQMLEFLKIPSVARYLSKMIIREAPIKSLAENREADLQRFVGFANLPQVQAGLGKYLESLSKKG